MKDGNKGTGKDCRYQKAGSREDQNKTEGMLSFQIKAP
jgi:hypothetical protein